MADQEWPNDFAPHIRNKTFTPNQLKAAIRHGALKVEDIPQKIRDLL